MSRSRPAFRLQKAQAPRPKARRERWKESKDSEKVKVMKVVKVVKVHQDRFLYFFDNTWDFSYFVMIAMAFQACGQTKAKCDSREGEICFKLMQVVD